VKRFRLFTYFLGAFSLFIQYGWILCIGIILFWLINDKKQINEPISNKIDQEEDYHNDFSKVGSGDRNIQVKPIDYTGDVWAHNRETLQDDLKNLGIDPFKK